MNHEAYPDEYDLDRWPPPQEFRPSVFAVYEGLDLRLPPFPKRSEFYYQPPYGIGTFESESCVSFLNRLATNHRVSFGRFLRNTIRGGSSSSISSVWRFNWAIPDWTYIMFRSMTLRNDLSGTMISGWPYTTENETEDSLRKWKVWCPECLIADENEDRQPYERLYWTLKSNVLCTRHGATLVDTCFNCGKRVPIVANYSRTGHCSKCNQWLGKNPDKAQLRAELDEMRRLYPGRSPEEYASEIRVGPRFLKRSFPHLYASLDRRYWDQQNTTSQDCHLQAARDVNGTAEATNRVAEPGKYSSVSGAE